MAAYAATVTLDIPHVERISRNLGILTGICDVTNYNSTLVAITGITGYFKTILSCIAEGTSDNGYLFTWITASLAFKCWYPRPAQTADTADRLTITASGAANITDGQSVTVNAAFRSAVDASAAGQLADDVDAGAVRFIAVGRI